MQDLQWIAIYNDGEQLCQIDNKGVKHSYEDIDRKRLSSFTIGKPSSKGIIGVFRANFDNDGENLIWRRRVQKTSDDDELILHIVGKKHRYVALVYQTGAVQLYDNFNEENAITSTPELLLQEM